MPAGPTPAPLGPVPSPAARAWLPGGGGTL